MQISTSFVRGFQIVKVSGIVNGENAGRLYDALVKSVGTGQARLIVDLSQVEELTYAGSRGLVVAAKLAESARGGMRIAGARPSVETVLRNLGFNHLLTFDPTVGTSMAALALDRTATLVRGPADVARRRATAWQPEIAQHSQLDAEKAA